MSLSKGNVQRDFFYSCCLFIIVRVGGPAVWCFPCSTRQLDAYIVLSDGTWIAAARTQMTFTPTGAMFWSERNGSRKRLDASISVRSKQMDDISMFSLSIAGRSMNDGRFPCCDSERSDSSIIQRWRWRDASGQSVSPKHVDWRLFRAQPSVVFFLERQCTAPTENRPFHLPMQQLLMLFLVLH